MDRKHINTYHTIKHGMSKTSEYSSWEHLISRCYNQNNNRYHDYAGRGIFVCRRWRNNFLNFYKDMGNKPSKNYSIDRIDNNGPYAPWNCKWSNKKEQSRNTRKNKNITYNGETKCVFAWAEALRINPSTLSKRLSRGWSIDKAFKNLNFRFKEEPFLDNYEKLPK